MKIMQEEIFAPILPIMNYEDISEAVDYITERDKPLALYVFSHNQELIDYVLQHTTSGNASVNDVVVHFTDVNLPFGGVNTSGIGSYHGVYGFKEFSHEKAYLFKPLKRIRADDADSFILFCSECEQFRISADIKRAVFSQNRGGNDIAVCLIAPFFITVSVNRIDVLSSEPKYTLPSASISGAVLIPSV